MLFRSTDQLEFAIYMMQNTMPEYPDLLYKAVSFPNIISNTLFMQIWIFWLP